MTRLRSALVALLVAAPFYWLLIDTTYSPDLIAGGVAVVIAAGAYTAARFESTENAAFRLRWIAVVLRELAKVPQGMWIVSSCRRSCCCWRPV